MLARGCQVSLQEVPLLLRVRTPITVIQLAVERDEVSVAPIEGVVALGAGQAAEGRMEVFEEGGAVPLPHVVVAEDREKRHSLDEVSVGSEEAAVVVALLACRVDQVARVQD